MEHVVERIKQLEKIILVNKYSVFVCDLIFYSFYIAREELWSTLNLYLQ